MIKTPDIKRMALVPGIGCLLAACLTSVNAFAAKPIIHDAEYYVIEAQNGERWKAEDKQIRSAVFSVLHSPPSAYGINRTSWKLRDLRKCLADKSVDVSFEVMREIIKTAGYRWRRARVVLTSTDPE